LICDNVVPFAVRWYTGEAMPMMEEEEGEEEGEEEEEGEGDDSEESDA
jgi:hypothetical protein